MGKKKKASFISGAISFLLLAAIINEFSAVIIPIVVVLLVLTALYFYGKHKETQTDNAAPDFQPQPQSMLISKEQARRQVEILTDSIELVNDSNDLDVVLHRYNLAIDSLTKLSAYTSSELNTLGITLKEPIQNTLCKMQDNKVKIFNQAITRNLEHEINSAAKIQTKLQRISDFRSRYENNMLLPPESKEFLASQCDTYASMYVYQKHIQINSIDHTVQTLTVYGNGQYTYDIQNDDFTKKFYELSSLIDSSRDIYAKLDACEKSYPLLKEFCRFCLENDDGELPPIINCRDTGPEMYMRLGRWEDAERAIQICADANAYYPDNDNEAWSYYNTYKRIASLAVSYIKDNPGCLQNKIYDAINVTGDERETLKHFLRCSFQIRKEKSGKTNRLYLATEYMPDMQTPEATPVLPDELLINNPSRGGLRHIKQ